MKKKQTTTKRQTTWTPAKRAAFAAKMKAAREAAAATKKPKKKPSANPPTFTVIRVNRDPSDTHAASTYAQAFDLANPDDGSRIEVFELEASDAGAARLAIDAHRGNFRARIKPIRTFIHKENAPKRRAAKAKRTTKNPPHNAPTIALPENVRLPHGFIWGEHWTDGRREGFEIRRLDRATYLPDGTSIVAELRGDMSYAHGHVEPGDLDNDEMTPAMVREEILGAFELMDKRPTKNAPATKKNAPPPLKLIGLTVILDRDDRTFRVTATTRGYRQHEWTFPGHAQVSFAAVVRQLTRDMHEKGITHPANITRQARWQPTGDRRGWTWPRLTA